MWTRVYYAIGALFGCVLGLGASLTMQDTSTLSIASTPLLSGGAQANLVMELTLSQAHAAGRGRKGAIIRRRRGGSSGSAAEPEAKEKPQEEDTWRATLPAGCVYDSYASSSSAADAYMCDGVQYRKSQKNGVTGYEMIKP